MTDSDRSMKGRLFVVGSGIQLGQMTIESAAHIEQAEKVFYIVTDPITEHWIKSKNDTAESLKPLYIEGQERIVTYNNMVETILDAVRQGKKTCAVFYGHPGIFVNPGHRAVRIALEEGHEAKMLPGISAEDCLFSDLGVDPANGCQSFEATDFLVRQRVFDPTNMLVIWQIGAIGEYSYNPKYENAGLRKLQDFLLQYYPRNHAVTVYEASEFVVCEPRIEWVELEKLSSARVTGISTLYVPPYGEKEVNIQIKEDLDKTVKTDKSYS